MTNQSSHWDQDHDLAMFGLVSESSQSRHGQVDDSAILTQAPPHPMLDDAIFIALDVEKNCHPPQSLSEIGYAYLDTRHVKDIPPGDRCKNWFAHIRTEHIRITDDWHSREGLRHHNHWCRPKGHIYAFGNTQYKTLEKATRFLKSTWGNLLKDSQTRGLKRKVVLVAWAKHMEAATITELGLGWLFTAHKKYDFQLFPAAKVMARQRGKQNIRLEDFVDAVGMPIDLPDIGSLLHNGGNDAGIELQCFLAGAFLTKQQLTALSDFDKLGKIDLPLFGRTRHVRGNIARDKEHEEKRTAEWRAQQRQQRSGQGDRPSQGHQPAQAQRDRQHASGLRQDQNRPKRERRRRRNSPPPHPAGASYNFEGLEPFEEPEYIEAVREPFVW